MTDARRCSSGRSAPATPGVIACALAVLLAARPLAALPQGETQFVGLLQGDTSRTAATVGTVKVSLRQALAKAIRSGQPAEPADAPATSSLAPLQNDTIPPRYWARVDAAIENASWSTPRPVSRNDALPTLPPPGPYERLSGGSGNVTGARVGGVQGWQARMRAAPESANAIRTTAAESYNMVLGARIMHGLFEDQLRARARPTQVDTSESFMAKCPMVMFSNSIDIKAPHCGSELGEWVEPTTQRAVLRWRENSKGGIYFGVDSAVTGPGSVAFAEVDEDITVSTYQFELYNCLRVARYTVEETITRLNAVGERATSTRYEHAASRLREAYFYKYSIKHPNGTTIAETNLYRLDGPEVNFTMLDQDGVPTGPLIANARRRGNWHRDEWRRCSTTQRAWSVNFPNSEAHFQTVATIQDLRVVTATVITLMAFRDELTDDTGVQRRGQAHITWVVLRTCLLILLALGCARYCMWRLETRGWDTKLRRFFFKLEEVLLPRTPLHESGLPIVNPTY